MFDRLSERLVHGLLAVAALTAFALSFLVTADVVGRVFFNSPVKGTPELVSMSIVIICFLLAGYSVQSGSMIYTDVFSSMFGVRGRAFAQLLSALLGILFFGLIIWGSYEPMSHAWYPSSPTATATSPYSRALMLRSLMRFIVFPWVGSERHDAGLQLPPS